MAVMRLIATRLYLCAASAPSARHVFAQRESRERRTLTHPARSPPYMTKSAIKLPPLVFDDLKHHLRLDTQIFLA